MNLAEYIYALSKNIGLFFISYYPFIDKKMSESVIFVHNYPN